MATDPWGIDDGWADTAGTWHPASTETIDAIRTAMLPSGEPGRSAGPNEGREAGDRGGSAPPEGRPVRIVRPGRGEALPDRGRLVLESGEDLGEVDRLPPDVPLGIHELAWSDGSPSTSLIVSPGRCHLPRDLHTWGVTMQVPTTRSSQSWGIGDLADVRTVASWIDRLGGGALGLSPLHASTPVSPLPSSPYFPSSRRWRNPLLLRVDAIAGAETSGRVAQLASEARRHLDDPVVDRDRCWALQREALEGLWRERGTDVDRDVAQWRREQGDPLEGWARYCALAERHGPGWSAWPASLRHPDGPAVVAAAEELADRVAFHAWLQLLLQQQLDRAHVGDVRLIQDLAIGVDPDGADAWRHQDVLALGVSVGAPPDDFAPDGQSWGLPPFIPWRLRDAGYRPLAEVLRASLATGGGLRVDHIMGLSRLFWIPDGGSPADGTYVRFAGRELLEVLAMESARAGAIVVGEDLGTVEEGFRDELRATDVLSTRLVWFEDVPPERYPREALAMVTTHDLPTVAGVWSGADAEELRRLQRPDAGDPNAELRERLDALVDTPADGPVDVVVTRVHERLGRSRAALVLATMEDLCAVEHRPNLPGTTDERANWSASLRLPVDELITDDAVGRTVEALASGRAHAAD